MRQFIVPPREKLSVVKHLQTKIDFAKILVISKESIARRFAISIVI